MGEIPQQTYTQRTCTKNEMVLSSPTQQRIIFEGTQNVVVVVGLVEGIRGEGLSGGRTLDTRSIGNGVILFAVTVRTFYGICCTCGAGGMGATRSGTNCGLFVLVLFYCLSSFTYGEECIRAERYDDGVSC